MMIKSSISNLTCLIEQQMAWKLSVNFQEERKILVVDKNDEETMHRCVLYNDDIG